MNKISKLDFDYNIARVNDALGLDVIPVSVSVRFLLKDDVIVKTDIISILDSEGIEVWTSNDELSEIIEIAKELFVNR